MIRKAFLLIALLLLSMAVEAGIPEIKFKRLDTRNGLSNSQVNCVFRDSHGYVWIGTSYGLNRYDGYRVKTFYSNMRDTTTMRDNYTEQIMEDYQGNLWLKQGMNYCIYDPLTESFERDVNRVIAKFLKGRNAVERVHIDQKKNFWFKFYDEGIFYYNPETKKASEFKLGYGANQFKEHYGIAAMDSYKDGAVIVTYTGEMVFLNGEKGIIEREDTWMREHGTQQSQNYKLTVDQSGNYWVIAEQFNYVYLKKQNRWYGSLVEALREWGITSMPDNLQVWDIKVDHHGWLWVATDHEGLFVIDPKDHQMRQMLNSKFDESTISDNTPRHVNIDNQGQIWIGTYKNGVNQYKEGLESIRSLELGDINTVVEDRHGYYWLGSNTDGIIVYDPRTEQVVSHYTKDNSALYGNIMVGSCRASDGSIWFGSYNGGLTRCIPSKTDPTQATIVNWLSTGDPQGLATNNVWSVTEDKWGRIWIATLGGGIQMLDLKTGKFRTWNTDNTGLPSNYLTSVWWIKKGWLMIGTSWFWCFVNPVTGKVANRVLPETDYLPTNMGSTSCVMEDSRGLIWQGSASGAAVLDQKTKQVRLLDMSDGLFGSSVNSIIEDKDHTMWVVTEHGVSKILPEKQEDGIWQFTVRSYNNRDGLQQEVYNQRSTYLTHDGLILIGGQGGLDVINPKALSNVQSKERPIFSGLQIFDADVPVGKEVDGRVILDEALDYCREITLNFNDQFTVQLGSDAGNVNNGKRFVYMLEGFHENWVKTSELNPNITYNSLRAGDYTLHVRMLNDDGTFGEEEGTLEITIRPSLWRTRWMVLLYMVLIAAAAWWWRKWFLKRQQQRMQAETLRRETEKMQWMGEMRMQMAAEQAGSATKVAEEAAAKPALQPQLAEDDLVVAVKGICKAFGATPEGQKAKLSCRSMVDELMVRFDKELLTEAMNILMGNSVRFSPGNCQISVNLGRSDERKAVIQVADNGIGIREEFKAKVFEPMVGSEGIGLDRVKDIVEAHGGTIRLEDNPGGGSVFVITLPAEPEVVVEEAIMMDEE